jgi:RNA polymerase sigma-70 factor (ECF subfamily)
MNAEESAIWTQIQQKNIRVFEKFYKEEYKRFFLMAFQYLKDADLSQEVVNDVFMKLWEEGSGLTIEKSLVSYIYRAVINRSLNLLEKQKREAVQLQSFSRLQQDEQYELKQMEENELKAALYKAIEQLPDQCRRVFQLSRFEQLKQQEIADQLGISIKTVKNHITHALKQLHKITGELLIIGLLLVRLFFFRG